MFRWSNNMVLFFLTKEVWKYISCQNEAFLGSGVQNEAEVSKQMMTKTNLTPSLAQKNKSYIKLEMYFVSEKEMFFHQDPHVA